MRTHGHNSHKYPVLFGAHGVHELSCDDDTLKDVWVEEEEACHDVEEDVGDRLEQVVERRETTEEREPQHGGDGQVTRRLDIEGADEVEQGLAEFAAFVVAAAREEVIIAVDARDQGGGRHSWHWSWLIDVRDDISLEKPQTTVYIEGRVRIYLGFHEYP